MRKIKPTADLLVGGSTLLSLKNRKQRSRFGRKPSRMMGAHPHSAKLPHRIKPGPLLSGGFDVLH